MKHLAETLNVFDTLFKKKNIQLIEANEVITSPTKALLIPRKTKGFDIQFPCSDEKKIKLGISESLVFKDLDLNLILTATPFFINSVFDKKVNSNISSFQTSGFNEKGKHYFRLVIKSDIWIDLFDHIDINQGVIKTMDNKKQTYYMKSISVSFPDNVKVEAFFLQTQNNNFFIIESNNFLNFFDFKKFCFSIINSLALISGKFFQDQGIFFSYKNKEMNSLENFYYTELRDSANLFYYPICAVPVRINEVSPKKAKEIERSSRLRLTLNQFSNLCNKGLDSFKFSSIILLIIESSTASLLSRPAGYSVALEGLTELICLENEKKIKPIKNSSLAKSIRKEMKELLNKYQDKIDSDGFKILETRLNNLNSPTNQSKLLKPFELLNIPITQDDIDAIKHRNSFLHGDINLGNDLFDPKETMITHQKVYYISLKLFTLLNALLLKYIGYDGSIINSPKIHEKHLGRNINEEFYRKI